jgi:uncharacterized membrane protein YeaQ/YmgE (transglycosylase-associated protein family)
MSEIRGSLPKLGSYDAVLHKLILLFLYIGSCFTKGELNMGWIVIIVVGALIGWLASKLMGTDDQQGALANIAIGIVGSLLGTWFFGGILKIGSAGFAGSFSIWGIIWGVAGSVILIAILKAFKVLK